ncbi:MAG TPA: hypothetical protein VNJ01_10745 [Bacteriovoracaceae bacterium]|nr:hypothetical protein [Bacteriovoracaceae bacterium]
MRNTIASILSIVALSLTSVSANAQFTQDPAPAPRVDSQLNHITVSPSGRVVAVGESKEAYGGSSTFPLILEKSSADGTWKTLEAPDLGNIRHVLSGVAYLPGADEDFVAVGQYSPPGEGGHMQGLILRYHRSANRWDIRKLNIGSQFMLVKSVLVDPQDSNRILIAGTSGKDDGAGFCFKFHSMVVEYRLDNFSFAVAPSVLGSLKSIVMTPDKKVFAFGIAAAGCDYIDQPLALEFDRELKQITTIPNPPSASGHPGYALTGSTATADGKIFVVGVAGQLGLAWNSVTLAYRLDPATRSWETFKPTDPDLNAIGRNGYINQLWSVTQAFDGRIYAVGRYRVGSQGTYGYAGMIQSFDGRRWELQEEVPEIVSRSELNSITIGPNREIFTVGLRTKIESGYSRNRTLILRSNL